MDLKMDNDILCSTCAGSGEGMYGEGRCRNCRGTGEEPTEQDDDES